MRHSYLYEKVWAMKESLKARISIGIRLLRDYFGYRNKMGQIPGFLSIYLSFRALLTRVFSISFPVRQRPWSSRFLDQFQVVVERGVRSPGDC